ncbi:MAG: conjugal transfer protein [Sulfolobaceae archaeon]
MNKCLVALIPLIATLWIFEWTRKIAMALADVLAGLMIGGVVSAFMIAMLASSIQGVLFLVLAPAAIGADLAISIGLMVLSIRPAEHLAGSLGKIKR